MAAAVKLNRTVTLLSSSNTYLQYPVTGTLEMAEFGTDGSMIWATFRANGTGGPVDIRNIVIADPPTYMTGAELQTLREACHLSRDDLAELAGVEARTIKHWENGRGGVPADVGDRLESLARQVDAGAMVMMQALQVYGALQDHPAPLALARIKSPVDRDGNTAQVFLSCCGIELNAARAIASMPIAAQAAIIGRIQQGMQHLRKPVRVVWFDPAAYKAWQVQNPGVSAWRWAQEQLDHQAKPHRGDQPPTA